MGSSTGNLREHPDKPEPLNAAELSHLPPNQFALLSVLLEPRELSYTALCAAVKALPEAQRLTQSQIDGTLFELVKEGYLTSFMENGDVVYLLQLRPGKRPSKRDEQRLWNKFDLGLDGLDLDVSLPGLEMLKTPGHGAGLNRFNIPGLRNRTPPRNTPQPTKKTPAPPRNTVPGPGIQRFNIPGLRSSTPPADKPAADTPPKPDKEDARSDPE
jgi:hypothetical protein